MKKRYKAIFGNPPYSIRSGNNDGKKILWDKFSESSMAMAEEVYYITPYIWNQVAKKMIAEDKITKIDLTAGYAFNVGSSICYWNNHKQDKKEIYTKNKVIEIDRLSDIEYLPCDLENTLSIHKKMWNKKYRIGFKINPSIDYEELHNERDEVNCYPIYSTSKFNMKYTDERSIRKYGLDLYHSPKIMVGFTRDNNPFMDRYGEYGSEAHAYYLIDAIENLDIRMVQLKSKLAKFYFSTARQENSKELSAIALYRRAFRLFPDIPLSITTDQAIYEWLELTAEEIDIVERHAGYVDGMNERREVKRKNKLPK